MKSFGPRLPYCATGSPRYSCIFEKSVDLPYVFVITLGNERGDVAVLAGVGHRRELVIFTPSGRVSSVS